MWCNTTVTTKPQQCTEQEIPTDIYPHRSGPTSQDPNQHKGTMGRTLTENGFLTPKTIKQHQNPPNSTSQLNAAQTMTRDNQIETDKTPQGPLSDDPDPQDRTICHPTNPPQPWRTTTRTTVKTTQKQGMTEREKRDAATFPATTHIQHTPQCAQHTHLCGQRITPRQNHTQHKRNTRRVQLWTTPSQLSHATLNVFVRDGRRRLQTKTCVQKGISEK